MRAVCVRLFGGVSIIAAAVSILSAAAGATPVGVPDAVYYNAVNVTLPNSLAFSNGGTGFTSASIDETVYPGTPWHWGLTTSNKYGIPSLSATAKVGAGVKGEAGSNLLYYFQVVGAPGDVGVRVQASGSAAAYGENILNGYGHNEASASFFITDDGGNGSEIANAFADSNSRGFTPPGLQTFSYDQTLTLTVGMIYQVIMQATASAWDDQTATASVDPIFTAPTGYSILTSSGIGNGAPVAATPIPAALPLFTSALGGLGLLGWRRKMAASRA